MKRLLSRNRLHRLNAGAAIPGAVLRAGVPIIAILAMFVYGFSDFALGLLLLAATAAVIVPRTMAAWVVAVLVVLAMLFSEPDFARTSMTVLIVHSLHVLGALSLVIPAGSMVQMRVLLPSLWRFLGVQAASQALVFAAASLSAGVGGTLPWLAPVGTLGLLALTVFLVRQPRG